MRYEKISDVDSNRSGLTHFEFQMFILGACKNLGAMQLADSLDELLQVINASEEHGRTGHDAPKEPEHTEAAECERRHRVLISAVRVVRSRFERVYYDALSTTAELQQFIHRKCGSSGESSMYLPELDLVFMQATLQKATSLPLDR
jgi:hypothetical protein